MELTKLILEFVRVLAWPVSTLVLVLIFRIPLAAILSRLRKADLPGGVSVDFEQQIQEAKELSEKVEAIPPPADRPKPTAIPLTEANARMISVGLRPTASGLDMNYYREIAQNDPTLALAGLRIELEVLANNIARGFKLVTRNNEPLSSLLYRLKAEGAITLEQLKLTRKILSICNQAVHGRAVTKQEAEEVIDAASVLAQQYLNWLSWGFPDNWTPKGNG
ncbi:MAG: hypothetical protein WA734_07480 [Candidatus Acidiferrales bacterium]|jgi:hypothetical protein